MINLLANLIIFGHDNSMKIFNITAIIAIMGTAACSAPEPKPQPRIVEAPKPIALPAPTTVQAPAFVQPTGDWIDWPITAGNWIYRQDGRGSLALFGQPGADALLTLRCMQNDKQLFLSRAGNVNNGGKITVRTSHTLKSYNAASTGGSPPYSAIAINPSDAVLDALVYTRGRFAVEADGLLSIAVPAWSEIARVIEDCR